MEEYLLGLRNTETDAKEKKMNTIIGCVAVRLVVGLDVVSVMNKHC